SGRSSRQIGAGHLENPDNPLHSAPPACHTASLHHPEEACTQPRSFRAASPPSPCPAVPPRETSYLQTPPSAAPMLDVLWCGPSVLSRYLRRGWHGLLASKGLSAIRQRIQNPQNC